VVDGYGGLSHKRGPQLIYPRAWGKGWGSRYIPKAPFSCLVLRILRHSPGPRPREVAGDRPIEIVPLCLIKQDRTGIDGYRRR
jgi:hypothetical protein